MVLPSIANYTFTDSVAQVSVIGSIQSSQQQKLLSSRIFFSGRAGKQGKGLLVLLPFETSSLPAMRKRRILKDDKFTLVVESSAETDKLMEPVKKLIRSNHVVLTSSAENAFKAFLAYYTATAEGMKGPELMESAAMLARSVGLAKLPSISEQLEDKLN
jgi:hypothetical protein